MKNNSVFKLTLTGILVSILAIGSQVIIPIGIIPITLQTLFVGLIASLFPLNISLVAITTYLILGALGFPVFAAGKSGVAVLFGPSGGYLWSFIVVVITQRLIVSKINNLVTQGIANLVGQFTALLIGTIFLGVANHLNPNQAYLLGFYPFIAGALIKAIITILLVQAVNKTGVLKRIQL
jgi:biotin transport system substrate-specific component